MKKTLLISVAAIALTAASMASAQTPSRGPAGAAPAAPSSATPSATAPSPNSAPAEIQATPDHGPAAKPGANKGAKSTTTPPTQRNTQQQPNKGAPPSNAAQTEPQHGAPNNAQHDERTGTNERGTHERQGANERPMTSRSVSLTTEQKTTIRARVLTSSAPRVQGRVNFDIRVGVVVPREVRVAPLPVELIEIQPEWRGYMYFVSGDEIIVVEPGTLRIVAVLDV